MKKTMFGLGVAALLALPGASSAQVRVGVGIDISFPEPPPLVVVSPGVQIVPEYDEEVYFNNGWYWVRRDDAWYRTRDCHGGWRPIPVASVPPPLMRMPPGRFRHYYRDDDGMWRPHRDDEWHAWRSRNPWEDRRRWWHDHGRDRAIRAEQERAWHEHERAEREHDRAEHERQRAEQERMAREHEREQREREREDRDRRRAEHESHQPAAWDDHHRDGPRPPPPPPPPGPGRGHGPDHDGDHDRGWHGHDRH